MITRETKVIHTTDRFMKVIFLIIAVCMVWLSLKDTRLEPGVTLSAQPGFYYIEHSGRIRN
mgnify:CR=1 FL=1